MWSIGTTLSIEIRGLSPGDIIMARSTKQISKSITSFLGNASKQWDTAGKLAGEVLAHSWQHGDSSLVVELDGAFADVNRNMFRAFRKAVGDLTPVILKKDASEDGHGVSSKVKRRKLLKDGGCGAAISDIVDGESLKAFLPATKPGKGKAKPTLTGKLHNVAEFVDSAENLDGVELKAAALILEQLQAEIKAKLHAIEANLGIENGVERIEVAEASDESAAA